MPMRMTPSSALAGVAVEPRLNIKAAGRTKPALNRIFLTNSLPSSDIVQLIGDSPVDPGFRVSFNKN
jgi:hypothetical protein